MFFSYRIALYFCCFLFTVSTLKAQLNTLGAAQKTLSRADEVVAKTSEYVAKIDETFDKIKSNNLYKALIDGKEFSFPIGILPADGDKNYALGIRRVFMTPDGMFAEIYMKIPVSSNKSLYFLADKVPMSTSGGLSGDLRLYLLKSDSIAVGKGYNILFSGLESSPGDPEKSCFVTFNCKGFKDATLTGAVNFNKASIVKDSESKGQVSVKYYVQADKLSRFIIDLKDIPSFEFTNLPGFKCSVPSITLDKNDSRNAPDFALPAWYKTEIQALLNDPTLIVDGPAWEGVYIPSIDIDIPRSFKEEKPNEIVAIKARDLIIDQNGVTISTTAQNLLSGKLKSWEYSIDRIHVDLVASSLSRAGIEGQITLPISKKESQLGFGLVISKKAADNDLSYVGYIDIERNGGLVDATAFGVARIKLTHAKFEFEYSNKQFFPAAVLTGSITLSPKKKSADANSKSFASFGLEFSLLRLTTKAPYLDIDENGFAQMSSQGSMMSNFPVSITKPGLRKDNGGQRIGIYMTLNVKLQGSGSSDSKSANGFGGSASFTIWAKRDPLSQKWQYDNFQLDKIIVTVDNSSFSLRGELSTFEEDKVYGTGVCGYLELKVIKKLEIKVSAIFGRKGQFTIDPNNPPTDASMADNTAEYRYWFVDAAVTLPAIPVAPMVGINGFTGGLYHNMRLERDPTGPDESTVDCKTASGMRYIPDNRIFLGLLAGVGLQSIPTSAIFNGKITFGLEFNNNGGLNMVALWGGVGLITPPINVPDVSALKGGMDTKTVPTKDKDAVKSKTPDEATGSIRVTWFVQYDVPKETFIGDFDVYLDVAGVLTGIGAGGKAGHIAVMFSPDAKYVYMGIPLDPIGIDVLGLFKCTSYFCAGNKLPVPPIAPLPPEFGPPIIDYNALETGAGLSFGARVEVGGKFGADANILCKIWVGAELWLKAGFDLLITKTNQPVYCDDKERGINNWYATGQAFIAGGMRLGMDYDCGIGSGSKNLVNANLTAYVFAQLPKPSFLKGEMNVEIEILGIGGDATIKFELGDQCAKADADKNIVFISSVLPATGTSNVKVTEQITINFAKPIGPFKFNLPDESNPDGATLQYWATVGPNDVRVTAAGRTIAYTSEWNDAKTVLRISPSAVMPENTDVTVVIDVVLKNSTNTNGIKSESKTITFKTMFEPVKIDVANVAYAYPLPSMKNYYKSESNTGYVKLFTLPNKPMKLPTGYVYQVVFEQAGKEVARVTDVKVNNQTGVEQFIYTIPNEKFVNEKPYTLKITKSPVNVQQKETQDEDDYTLGYDKTPKDSVILEYDFTTSRFSSFSQKIAYYNQSLVELSGPKVTNTLSPNSNDVALEKAEGFTREETKGFIVGEIKTSEALVQAVGADFSNGFPVSGAPDDVAYSFYANKLVVQYNVFSAIDKANRDEDLADIVCTVNQTSSNCGGGSASGTAVTFPKAQYYYKLGYFLPGRNTKTSEALQSFTLPEAVTLTY